MSRNDGFHFHFSSLIVTSSSILTCTASSQLQYPVCNVMSWCKVNGQELVILIIYIHQNTIYRMTILVRIT